MPRRKYRNPRDGRKRRGSGDDTGISSDSDYVVDSMDEALAFSEDDDPVELPPIPSPIPKKRCKINRRSRGASLKWEIWEGENDKWVDQYLLDSEGPDSERPLQEVAEPSASIILPLLRYQKEFLSWALKQERSVYGGGILADEMGMGKTIQAISLVLTSRDRLVASIDQEPSSSTRTRATLVICPVVAVIQWAGEITRYTQGGSARVLVYHGPKRAQIEYDFKNYDFVITTYQTIEGDYRKNIMPLGKQCQYCGKRFHMRSMKIHLKYYCGPNARRTAKQAKQERKKKMTDYGKVRAKKQKGKRDDDGGDGDDDGYGDGKGKNKKQKKEKKNDDDAGKGKNKRQKKEEKDDCDGKGKGINQKEKKVDDMGDGPRGVSLLHSVKWERIILDEAHFIKDKSSNTARAIFALDSHYKWALSGTPLQNRVGELYSLVRFLQVYPYSNYFCKDCDCNIFDLPADSTTCSNCPHSVSRHFCWWNRYINKPIQDGNSKRAMTLLKGRVLKNLVLRRTKKGRAADLALPPKTVILRRDYLDKNEKEFYEALYTQSCVQFDAYVDAGTLMNNYAHIFDLLTRLRQAVDHPYLVVYSKTAAPQKDKTEDLSQDCSICHEEAEDAVTASCEHVFCKACLFDYSETLGKVSCPSCSKPLTVDLTTNIDREKNCSSIMKGSKRSGILSRIKLTDFKTSTKIDALMEEIRNMVEGDSSAKGLVFSQFTSFLDLINHSLQKSGVKCVQLVGSMSLAERDKAIKTFTADENCRIFLMSLKAGGVALNLTVASHVFLMDPWWNPAVESQAQDRIHRIGQFKPIRTVRFVIEDTIEERILKLQQKKELVFEGTVGDSKEAMSKLTEADLRFLFH